MILISICLYKMAPNKKAQLDLKTINLRSSSLHVCQHGSPSLTCRPFDFQFKVFQFICGHFSSVNHPSFHFNSISKTSARKRKKRIDKMEVNYGSSVKSKVNFSQNYSNVYANVKTYSDPYTILE